VARSAKDSGGEALKSGESMGRLSFDGPFVNIASSRRTAQGHGDKHS